MINRILKDYMGSRPNDMFIHYSNQNITYENMAYSLEGRIKSIQAINIQKDSVVGVYIDNGLDLIEVLFACIEIQAIPLIIPSIFKPNEILSICDEVKFDYFITNWNKSENLKDLGISTFPIEELSPSIGGCAPSKTINHSLNQVACLLLTTGTSGRPKIAQITIQNMFASSNAWHGVINFDQNDIYYNCLPLHHIGGLSIIFRALFFGFKIVLADKFNSKLAIDDMIQHNVSIISLVPTMLSRIIKSNSAEDISSTLRAVIVGGSDCDEDLIKDALDQNLNIYKSYGMTESTSGVAGFWVKNNLDHINSSGLPHNQVKFKIINNEICVKGPSIIDSYYKGDTINHWYCTNDRGYIDKNGFLYVLGRQNFVISGGENIDLKEIEDTINQHPKIKQVFVKSIKDDEWGDRLIAYINTEMLDLIEIKEWLKTKLANYKIPKEFIRID